MKIKGLKEKTINKDKLENDKNKLQEEQKLLENDVKQYNIINENITIDLPELNQEKIDIGKKILNQKENLEPFEKIIKELEDVPNLLKEIREKMNLAQANFNAYGTAVFVMS